jgi:hypothetical protein
MSQRIATSPTREADIPAFDQGEMEDKPIPVPNAMKINDNAAVAKAPATTADQEIPEACASPLIDVSG